MKKTILPITIITVFLVILIVVFTTPASAGYSEYNILEDRNFQTLSATVQYLQEAVSSLDPTNLEGRVSAVEAENAAMKQDLAEVKAENAALAEKLAELEAKLDAMNAPETEEEKDTDTTTRNIKAGATAGILILLTFAGVAAIAVGVKKN